MGLDLWFREDVARILLATQETMHTSLHAVPSVDAEMSAVYERGFADALRSVAIAFGVTATSTSGWQQALSTMQHADLEFARNGRNGASWSVSK